MTERQIGLAVLEAERGRLRDTYQAGHRTTHGHPGVRKLHAAGVPYQAGSGSSIYLKEPDGARIELLADPLGEMYGAQVL